MYIIHTHTFVCIVFLNYIETNSGILKPKQKPREFSVDKTQVLTKSMNHAVPSKGQRVTIFFTWTP